MPSPEEDGLKPEAKAALTQLLCLIGDYQDFNPETTVPTSLYPTDFQFSQQVASARPCVYDLSNDCLNDPKVIGTRTENDDHIRYQSGVKNDDEEVRWTFATKYAQHTVKHERQEIRRAPCFSWSKEYLCGLVKEDVEVAVTPDGRADALYSMRLRGNKGAHSTQKDTNEGKHDSSVGTDWVDVGNIVDAQNSAAKDASEVANELPATIEKLDITELTDDHEQTEQVFLQPATIRMSIASLLDHLCPPEFTSSETSTVSPSSSPSKPVYYLQSQDSNLSLTELAPILNDLPKKPPGFALSTLGAPEATNIWIGNEQSVTSTHRDPYENLYMVLKGKKKFVLYPPVEEVCLHAENVRTGKWMFDQRSGRFDVSMDEDMEGRGGSKIPWIPVDPINPPPESSTRYPYYKEARPLSVTVNEGEMLYLPAGWFHHVSQECGTWKVKDGRGEGEYCRAPCIAVNYWFDMDYSGEKHVMRDLVGRLVTKVSMNER